IGGKAVRAMKVHCGSRNRTTNETFTHYAWYAPDAKRVVRLVSHYAGGPAYEVTAWNVHGGGEAPPQIASPAPAPKATASDKAPAVKAPVPKDPAEKAPVAKTPGETPPAAKVPPAAAPAPPAARDDEPPKITLNYPPENATIEREQIVVLALVTDNVAVDRGIASVNGVMATMSAEQAMSERGRPIRAPVTLQPGENVIEVSAVDKAGNVAQVVRTVRRPAAAVAAPPAPPAPKNDQWAVVIGVG